MTLLEAKNIMMKFGGLIANEDISIKITKGEIVGLIGPNGAGKSTFFSIIAGSLQPTAGQIFYNDQDITTLPEHERSKIGISRTFQIVKTFQQMTVFENVMVGSFQKNRSYSQAKRKTKEILELTGLSDIWNMTGGNLTIADKKRVELARSLATEPELLMLDEVMAGLTPTETAEAVKLLKTIQKTGITLLVVEHVMEVVMPISNRVIVLDQGKKLTEGHPEEVVKDEKVIKAYLGEKYHVAG